MNCRLFKNNALVYDDLWIRYSPRYWRILLISLFWSGDRIIDAEEKFWTASQSSEYQFTQVVDMHGHIIAPGYIDLQMNGGFGKFCVAWTWPRTFYPGIDFTDPSITSEDVDRVGKHILAVRTWLLWMTGDNKLRTARGDCILSNNCLNLARCLRSSSSRGAQLVSLHLRCLQHTWFPDKTTPRVTTARCSSAGTSFWRTVYLHGKDGSAFPSCDLWTYKWNAKVLVMCHFGWN